MTTTEIKAKTQELEQAFAKLVEAAQKHQRKDYTKYLSKADMGDMGEADDGCCDGCDTVMSMCQNLSDRISYLSQSFWDYQYSHSQGHPVKINSPEGMQAYLDLIGRGEDFEIVKPSLYVGGGI